MSVYILRISGSYADEFNVNSIHEITHEQAQFLLNNEGDIFNSSEEIYFGTNEGVQVSELNITLDTISDLEAEVVRKVVCKSTYLGIGLIDLSDFIHEQMDKC